MQFWSELKRRNVVRVGALYIVASWVMLQVADVLFDVLELPVAWNRAVLAVLFLGFLLALIFAWAYEITPEGLRREAATDPSSAAAQAVARRLDYLTIGVVVLGIALFTIDRLELREAAPTPRQPIAGSRGAVAPTERPAVAVLPFTDLSAQRDQQFFADGIAEELIIVLSELNDLEVASRTSSFSYRNSPKDVRTIGRDLHVAAILEGSVRKTDKDLRVTVQLTDVETGYNLWSKNFEHRPLEDVFVIQEDIAAAVAGALGVTLGVGDVYQIKGAGTRNMKAYEAYLRGDFERAIELDSTYASAWARAGMRFAAMQWRHPPENAVALKERAYEFVSKAVELDPKLSHSSELATLKYALDRDWAASEQFFQHAMDKWHDDDVLEPYARMLIRAGRATAALDVRKEIRFPGASSGNTAWFHHDVALGEFDRARRYLQSGTLSPSREAELGFVLAIHRDSTENLQSALEDLAAQNSMTAVAFGPLIKIVESPDAVLRHLRAIFEDTSVMWPSKYHDIALFAAYYKEPEFAFEAFSKEIYYTSIRYFSLWYPVMSEMRKLPQFEQFVRDVNLLDYWRAHGWPDFCRPLGAEDFVCDRIPQLR